VGVSIAAGPRLHEPASCPTRVNEVLARFAADARQVLAEAERALRHCPEDTTSAHVYKAEALRLLGRHEEAQAAARMVPREIVIE
jgi:phytoene/squalene synthetase